MRRSPCAEDLVHQGLTRTMPVRFRDRIVCSASYGNGGRGGLGKRRLDIICRVAGGRLFCFFSSCRDFDGFDLFFSFCRVFYAFFFWDLRPKTAFSLVLSEIPISKIQLPFTCLSSAFAWEVKPARRKKHGASFLSLLHNALSDSASLSFLCYLVG